MFHYNFICYIDQSFTWIKLIMQPLRNI